MKKILFVAVHPDDETLGCGGTILKYKERGDEIYWLILTKANQKITEIVNIETIQKEYVKKVSDAYDFNRTYHLDFFSTELDQYSMSKLISKIKQIFDEIKPGTVYLPNRSDVHSDHKVAFEAVYACTKNFRAPYIKTILMYETLSETEFTPSVRHNAFIPNVYNDVTPYFEKKLEIMKFFTTEQMDEPLPRAMSTIRALARYRGSRISVEYAEAFVLLLDIR